MQEIKSKRNYNSKHFDLGGGVKQMVTSPANVHYYNKTGEGDGVVGFREVDNTLVWNEEKRGWEILFSNFQTFIPEYSADWITFRDLYKDKDQTIGFKALTGGAEKGELITVDKLADEGLDKQVSTNCILYRDAMAQGCDLIVFSTNSTLFKLVRIRKADAQEKKHYFQFALLEPTINEEKKKFKKDKQLLEYDNKDCEDFILSVGDNDENDDSLTFIKPMYKWDEGDGVIPNVSPVKVSFQQEGEYYTFTKKIDRKDIANSQGDLFTDASATYYPGAGDGDVGVLNTVYGSWSAIRAGSANRATPTDATFLQYTGSHSSLNQWKNLWRIHIPFDTSGLPDAATVTDADLDLYCTQADSDNFSLSLSLVESTAASNTTLATTDYQAYNTTRYATDKAFSTFSTSNYNTITLNSSGRSFINKTGWSKFSLMCDCDLDDSSPTWSSVAADYLSFSSSEATGTSQDPKLTVTYSEGGTTEDAIFFGHNF